MGHPRAGIPLRVGSAHTSHQLFYAWRPTGTDLTATIPGGALSVGGPGYCLAFTTDLLRTALSSSTPPQRSAEPQVVFTVPLGWMRQPRPLPGADALQERIWVCLYGMNGPTRLTEGYQRRSTTATRRPFAAGRAAICAPMSDRCARQEKMGLGTGGCEAGDLRLPSANILSARARAWSRLACETAPKGEYR